MKNPRDGPVTPREQQVTELLIDGHSNESIGHQLNISTETVKVHLYRAMAKWGASNRVELAVKVLKERHAKELKRVQSCYFDLQSN